MLKRKLLSFSLIFSLPVAIIFIIWLHETATVYRQFEYHFDFGTPGNRLYNTGRVSFFNILKQISLTSSGSNTDFSMWIDASSIAGLNKDLPLSGKSEKKALLYSRYTDKFYKVKARYRGDNSYHWLFNDKSWRLKTPKNKLFNSVRKFNFINPKGSELLNNHVSYKLAKILGLMAPDSEMISLNINKDEKSIKLYVPQLDESFLRQSQKMPGDIYKGDSMGTSFYDGLPRNITTGSYMWEKSSYNNHYDKDNLYPLKSFLDDIGQDKLGMANQEAFSKLFVFYSLINSFHLDNAHNWVLYYDNYYEEMYPIIWDPLGYWKDWDAGTFLLNITSDISEVFHKDYGFIRKEFFEYRNFFLHDENKYLVILEDEVQKVKNKVIGIKYNINVHQVIKNEKEINDELDDLVSRIKNRFKKLKSMLYDINYSDYKWSDSDGLSLSVGGMIPVSKVKITLDKPIEKPTSSYIKYYLNNLPVEDELSNDIVFNRNTIVITSKLLSNITVASIDNYKFRGLPVKDLKVDVATYQFPFLQNTGATIEKVEFELFDLNNTIIQVDYSKNINLASFKNVNNIIESKDEFDSALWSGEKYFHKSQVLKQDVNIEKGTKLYFAEGVTVKVLGKVTAIGTEIEPISFSSIEENKPWGAFVVKGERANGSTFKHCIFKDGSGSKGKLYEYTAMLSVHGVKGLDVESCEFYDSHISDDMVHVIYSDAKFTNTKFARAFSDALDVDISNVVIDNCEFYDSGNDAVDLMETDALIINTKFINSADKGVSIGEGSKLRAINNYIKGGGIGMQSKDSSVAYVYNSSFISNKIAVDAYHKNWRYVDGGSMFLDECTFESNENSINIGKKSKITIRGGNIVDVLRLDNDVVFTEKDLLRYDFNKFPFVNKSLTLEKDN